MKNITLLILILALFCTVVQPSFAKKKQVLDADTNSIQMVRQLTEAGNVQRTSDIPMIKADVEADTARAAKLRKDFEIQKYNDTKGYMNIWGKNVNLDPVLDNFNNNKNPEQK